MTPKQRAAIDAVKAANWKRHEDRLKVQRARKNATNREYRRRQKEAMCN